MQDADTDKSYRLACLFKQDACGLLHVRPRTRSFLLDQQSNVMARHRCHAAQQLVVLIVDDLLGQRFGTRDCAERSFPALVDKSCIANKMFIADGA